MARGYRDSPAGNLDAFADSEAARHERSSSRRWGGASLLATLAEVAGSQWTPEINVAWSEAYGAIASLMLARVGA